MKGLPHSIVFAHDLSKVFDTVAHAPLLDDIQSTKIPDPMKRWLGSYTRAR